MNSPSVKVLGHRPKTLVRRIGAAPLCGAPALYVLETVHPFHVGASDISLAPIFYKSQSTLILLLLLSKSQPLMLGCDLGLDANLIDLLEIVHPSFRCHQYHTFCPKSLSPWSAPTVFAAIPDTAKPRAFFFICRKYVYSCSNSMITMIAFTRYPAPSLLPWWI